MSTFTLPQPEAPPQAGKPKVPRCKGCRGPWLPGHSCIQPSRTPTTPTHWHRHDQGTQFGTFGGQRVYPVLFGCGCQRVGCAQSAEAEAAEVAWAAARPCSSCRFRVDRSALDVEMVRG